MKVGSHAHKELFCGALQAAHQAYDPRKLHWPALNDEQKGLLAAVPVWAEALRDELSAGLFLQRAADRIRDPLIRDAIALQAYEELRHARILGEMLSHYGLDVPQIQPKAISDDFTQSFTTFGFIECADSFVGCGFVALVRSAQVLPGDFLTVVDRILDEEIQHIVFFTNWFAYQHALGRRQWFSRAKTAFIGYTGAFHRIAGLAHPAAPHKDGYFPPVLSGPLSNITASTAVSTCIEEYDRRMLAIDRDLLKPRLLSSLARCILPSLKIVDRVLSYRRVLAEQFSAQ